MEVYIVIASPPKGHDEPWVSDVFASLELATAHAEEMAEICEQVSYHVEKYEVRTSLDVEIPDDILRSEPFFRGMGDVES